MKKLIKDFGFAQIYEEEKDNRCVISATNHRITEPLTTYFVDTYTKHENRRNFFRNVAINYFREIRSKFEMN